MRIWLFWIGLYGICVALALTAVPGVPEALGFALPALLAALAAAWLARRLKPRARLAVAVATAGALMLGAVTGTMGRNQAPDAPTAVEASAASTI